MPFHPRRGLGWRMLFSMKEGMTSSAPKSPLGFSAHRYKPLCTVKEMVVLSLPGNTRQVTSLCCTKVFPSFHTGFICFLLKGFWNLLMTALSSASVSSWFWACIVLFQHAKPETELYSWVVMSELMCVYTDLSGRPWGLVVGPVLGSCVQTP